MQHIWRCQVETVGATPPQRLWPLHVEQHAAGGRAALNMPRVLPCSSRGGSTMAAGEDVLLLLHLGAPCLNSCAATPVVQPPTPPWCYQPSTALLTPPKVPPLELPGAAIQGVALGYLEPQYAWG